MDIRAFRQDLQQKSNEAKKTYFTEDKINVTFSGIKSDAEASRYKQLAEVLQVQVDILEAVLNEAKKLPAKKKNKPAKPAKLAKKDYDQDGKIESGTAEWEGSRDNAIKKAIAKKEVSEAVVSKAKRLTKKYPERGQQAVAVKNIKLDDLETAMDATSMAAEKAYKAYKKEGHAGNPDASAKALRTSAIKDKELAGQYLQSAQHAKDLDSVLAIIAKAKKK